MIEMCVKHAVAVWPKIMWKEIVNEDLRRLQLKLAWLENISPTVTNDGNDHRYMDQVWYGIVDFNVPHMDRVVDRSTP